MLSNGYFADKYGGATSNANWWSVNLPSDERKIPDSHEVLLIRASWKQYVLLTPIKQKAHPSTIFCALMLTERQYPSKIVSSNHKFYTENGSSAQCQNVGHSNAGSQRRQKTNLVLSGLLGVIETSGLTLLPLPLCLKSTRNNL